MTVAAAPLSTVRSGVDASRRILSTAEALVVVSLLGALGMMLYRPWEAIPFPIVDFGGWLSVLTSSGTISDAFRALVVEHAREGRINPLSMAYVALNWAFFGDSTAGWQIFRGVIMLAIAVGAYVLLRLLGAYRGAAVAGACLFLLADSARAVWLMPQAFEHVAASFVVAASLAALSYYRSPAPRARAALIATLCVLAIWVREPMVAAVPFVVLLALSHRGDGKMILPRIDRRAIELVAIVGIAVLILNAVPVFAVRAVAEPGAYASRFGPENVTLANIRNVGFALALPMTRAPWFPANAVFLVAILVAMIGKSERARAYRRLLVVAATLPLGGALLYMMWPGFPGNYGLPYLLGVVIAFTLALTALWQGSGPQRGLAAVIVVVTLTFGVLLAINDRRTYAAARMLDVDMAAAVTAVRGSPHLEVAVDDPARAGAFGRALRAYSRAMLGGREASASDVDCTTAATRTPSPPAGVVVLRPPHGCVGAPIPRPTSVLRRTTTIRDWKTLRSRPWEVTAVLWHSDMTSGGRSGQ